MQNADFLELHVPDGVLEMPHLMRAFERCAVAQVNKNTVWDTNLVVDDVSNGVVRMLER